MKLSTLVLALFSVLVSSTEARAQFADVEVGFLGGYGLSVRDLGKSAEEGSRIQVRGKVKAAPFVGASVSVPLPSEGMRLRLQGRTVLSGETETDVSICSVLGGAICAPTDYETSSWDALALVEFGRSTEGPRRIRFLVGVGAVSYGFTEPQCGSTIDDLLCRLATDLLEDQTKPQIAFGVSFQQDVGSGGVSFEVLNSIHPYTAPKDTESISEGEIQNGVTLQGRIHLGRR